MSPVQIHTLRACSLLVIPPSTERVPPPGGFPTDLSDLNLSGWVTLVQDVASGLQALPPNLGQDMSLPAVALLQVLETTTGLGFCSYCCHLGSRCTCMGAYQLASPQSWSQIVEQTPGCGVTASSGGMTTPSTTATGMSGYAAPRPGLTPIDFSSWRLSPPEAPTSRGLPAAPPGLPGVGRSLMLRGAAERNARAQMAQCPGSLTQRAKTQPMSVPHAPQTVLPLCQPLPGWLATLYQQVVQLPKKSTGRGVAYDPPAGKLPPWVAQVHRTLEDLPQGGGETVADPSVTPEVCRGRQVHSRHIRRVLCPPGQCQVFHHQRHLKGHSLSGEVGLRPPTVIPLDWWQNYTVLGKRKTLSMCSGSTTSLTLPTLGRQIGYNSGTHSSHTFSSTRRRH